MLRLLCCIILAAFIVGAIGCGQPKPPDLKTPPIGQKTPPPQPPPQKPPPTEDELWLSQTCGQCHKTPEEQKAKLDAVKAMATEDLEKVFREKCLPAAANNPEVKFTDAEITKALEMHKKMLEQIAEKKAAATPEGGTTEAPTESGT